MILSGLVATVKRSGAIGGGLMEALGNSLIGYKMKSRLTMTEKIACSMMDITKNGTI